MWMSKRIPGKRDRILKIRNTKKGKCIPQTCEKYINKVLFEWGGKEASLRLKK